jgi:hypothetical protein
MPRGGKRAGAGRKRAASSKESNFSTRITADLRARLQREAKYRGHSLSREIERRLEESVQSERQDVWGKARDLGLALLVNRVTQAIGAHTGENWVVNDYTFRAVRAAAEELFRILDAEMASPGRDPTVPAKIAELEKLGDAYVKTPEEIGRSIANGTWYWVMTLEMPADLSRSVNPAHRILANMRGHLGIRAAKN